MYVCESIGIKLLGMLGMYPFSMLLVHILYCTKVYYILFGM